LSDNQTIMPTTTIKGRDMSLRHSITGGFILSVLFSLPAQACSDDSCYPTWDLKRDLLDTCNNTPFLSPANDSRVNLQLLLADYVHTPLPTSSADNYYKDQGYAQVRNHGSTLTTDQSSHTTRHDQCSRQHTTYTK